MEPVGDSQSLSQPLAKKRRSTFDHLREKQLARQQARSGQASQSTQLPAIAEQGPASDSASKAVAAEPVSSAVATETSNALVAVSNEEESQAPASALYAQESISVEVGHVAAHEMECEEQAARFDAAARHRSERLEEKWRSTLQRRDSKPNDEPVLTSSESITSDFSVKSGVHLATPHGSFKWLRLLPLALRNGAESTLKGPARDAALAVCEEHLPTLMDNTDMAMKWMAKLCAQLIWYEVEGPLVLSTAVRQTPSAVPEERSAKAAYGGVG